MLFFPLFYLFNTFSFSFHAFFVWLPKPKCTGLFFLLLFKYYFYLYFDNHSEWCCTKTSIIIICVYPNKYNLWIYSVVSEMVHKDNPSKRIDIHGAWLVSLVINLLVLNISQKETWHLILSCNFMCLTIYITKES